jgi:hypothetical protein
VRDLLNEWTAEFEYSSLIVGKVETDENIIKLQQLRTTTTTEWDLAATSFVVDMFVQIVN